MWKMWFGNCMYVEKEENNFIYGFELMRSWIEVYDIIIDVKWVNVILGC